MSKFVQPIFGGLLSEVDSGPELFWRFVRQYLDEVAKIDLKKKRSKVAVAEFLTNLTGSWQPRVLPEGGSEH
jgi:hypothetical protein